MGITYYDTGTATLAVGSKTMTGQGTLWAGWVKPGDQVIPEEGTNNVVDVVVSNTEITLLKPYRGVAQAARSYTIMRTPDVVFTESLARQVLQGISGSALLALSGLVAAARKGIRFGATSSAELFDLSDFALSFLDDASGSAVLTTLGVSDFAKTLLDDTSTAMALGTLGIKGVRQIKKVNSTATPVSTSSTDFVQVEAISLTAATPVSSPTSSLLVLCNLQVESSRGGTAGQTGVSANMFRYTGSTYTTVGDPTVQSLDTASTEAVNRIVRGQLQLMSFLPASARRSDLTTTWTVAPYFANIYSGAIARVMLFNALMIEIEP